MLRYAHLAAMEVRSNLHIIHAIQSSDPDLPIRLEPEEQIQSEESQKARQRIAELQRRVGAHSPVRMLLAPSRRHCWKLPGNLTLTC